MGDRVLQNGAILVGVHSTGVAVEAGDPNENASKDAGATGKRADVYLLSSIRWRYFLSRGGWGECQTSFKMSPSLPRSKRPLDDGSIGDGHRGRRWGRWSGWHRRVSPLRSPIWEAGLSRRALRGMRR